MLMNKSESSSSWLKKQYVKDAHQFFQNFLNGLKPFNLKKNQIMSIFTASSKGSSRRMGTKWTITTTGSFCDLYNM